MANWIRRLPIVLALWATSVPLTPGFGLAIEFADGFHWNPSGVTRNIAVGLERTAVGGDIVPTAWRFAPVAPELLPTFGAEPLREIAPVSYAEMEPDDEIASPVGGTGAEEIASGGGPGSLAQLAQNPVASLASVPFQCNGNFGIGPDERSQFVGNLQPVVPWKINEQWNLITRAIVPFVNLPVEPDSRLHGIGDTIGQFFLSPREPQRVIWGLGPAVLFPTASDAALGRQEWGVGITGVALISEGPIVAGVLMYQIWGTEGNTKPFLVQPFFNYNLQKGWFISISGEGSADWELPNDLRWSFPLGAGIGRTFPLAGQPISISTRFAPYLLRPEDGPDWQFRLQLSLLFPR